MMHYDEYRTTMCDMLREVYDWDIKAGTFKGTFEAYMRESYDIYIGTNNMMEF